MNNYTVTFNKQMFINAINILGFKKDYIVSMSEVEVYFNNNKYINIEIYSNPFIINIIDRTSLDSKHLSYKHAYGKLHELII